MQAAWTTAGASDASNLGAVLEPHRRALELHCYRMTGSLHDAEDLAQETLVRGWQKYASFTGRSSLRTWLYRIATNVCLDALKRRRPPRRLRPKGPPSDVRLPVGPPTEEASWLQPYPDSELAGTAEGPEDSLLARERVSLAFCAALQLLPPRQRAILLLSDVLDWRAAEIGELLGMSSQAVDSALHRARTTLARNNRAMEENPNASGPDNAAVKDLLDRYLEAWHANDVDGLVELLHRDAVLSMPPFSSWYQGRESVIAILSLHPFGFGLRAGWRLSPTRANGQPAFVLHRADEVGKPFKAFGVMVLSMAMSPGGPSISEVTVYKDTELVSRFGFPPEM
jgi:RNA polymerase sigma-70 factor, ECF subfamily